jgi:hypothetical protein
MTPSCTFRNVRVSPIAETMLSLFKCTGVETNSAVYVSTPITTGELLISWHEGTNSTPERAVLDPGELRSTVIEQNLATVIPLIQRVRTHFDPVPVIEPVSMSEVPDWLQPDYHRFWCAFVERFANTIVLNQGWHLSNGCATEFATAVLAEHRILDHNLDPLPIHRGLQLLNKAVDRLETAQLDTSILRSVVSAVRQHAGEPE